VEVTFLAPNAGRAVGGVLAILEFASGLARRGHDVHVVHVDADRHEIDRPDDITWVAVDERVDHRFPRGALTPHDVPSADFVIGYDATVPCHAGLPLVFVQAAGILMPSDEEAIYAVPYPKICTSSWLRRVAIENGVPPEQAFHVPYGMHHDRYRLIRPIAGRPPRVAMLANPHPVKGARLGLAALRRVRQLRPEVEVVLFGNTGGFDELGDEISFVEDPEPATLVDEVYNGSRVFITSSLVEGFGLASIEAMACGCALATTDNGGADDYAISGLTALVSDPDDVHGLSQNILRLIDHADIAAAMAERGRRFVQRFDWDRSALELEAVLHRYGDDAAARRRRSRPVDYSSWARPSSAMFRASRVQSWTDDRARSLHTDDLEEAPYRYLWFGLSRQRVGDPDRPGTATVVVAAGVNSQGADRLLDFALLSEASAASISSFAAGLTLRGLSGTELVVVDNHPRLVKGLQAALPGVGWQRRRSDIMLELLALVPEADRPVLATRVRSIFEQPNGDAVRRAHARLVAELRRSGDADGLVAARLEDAAAEITAFSAFPRSHWPSLLTNATQHRLEDVLDPLAAAVGVFPSLAMLNRLVTFLVVEDLDSWIAHARQLDFDRRLLVRPRDWLRRLSPPRSARPGDR
jgi:glycosyltransferase involved in cell wall biosynthesis